MKVVLRDDIIGEEFELIMLFPIVGEVLVPNPFLVPRVAPATSQAGLDQIRIAVPRDDRKERE